MANLTPVGVQAVVEGFSSFMGELGKMDTGIQGVGKSFADFGSKLATGAAVAGIGAVSLAIGGLVTASKIGLDSLMGWGDQLDRLGDQFGTTGEQGSVWTVAMNRVGLSVEEGAQGLNYFTKNLDDVKSGVGAATGTISPFQKALDKMGINAFDATGNVRSLDDLMPEIMDKFQKLPVGVNASALAMDLFGARGGTKFLDFLRQGSQGLADAEKMAKEFGLTMSTDDVNATEEYGFALNELNLGLTGIKNQIGKAVLPYARQFVDWAKGAVPTVVKLAQVLADKLGAGLQFITNLIGAFQAGGFSGLAAALGLSPQVITFIDSLIASLVNLAGTIRDRLAAAFTWVSQNAMPLLMQGFDWLVNTGFPAINQAIDFVTKNWDAFGGAILGVIVGGGVLAIITTIASAIAAIASPIGLVIAAFALLGAAWSTNFMGMRDTLIAFWTTTAYPALQQLWQWLQINVPIAIAYLSNLWTSTLLPALQQTGVFIQTVVIPALQQAYNWLIANLPAAIQALVGFWNGTLLPALQMTGSFIMGTVIPALSQVWTWLSDNLPAAIQALAGFWNGVLLPALQATGAFIMGTVIPAIVQVYTWLATNIPAAIQAVSGFWTGTLLPAIQSVSDFITGTAIPTFNNMVTFISGVLTAALQANSAVWGTVGGAINTVATWINTYLMPAFSALGGFINAVLNLALTAMAGLWQNVIYPALTIVGAYIQTTLQPTLSAVSAVIGTVAEALGLVGTQVNTTVTPALNTLTDIITNVLGLALQTFINSTLTQFRQGLQGIQDALGWVTDKLNGLTGSLNSVQLPDWLKPGSPTPFEMGLRGIADMLSGKLTKALEVFGAAAPPIFKLLAETVAQIKTDLSDMAETTLVRFGEAMGSVGSAMVSSFTSAWNAIENMRDTLDDLRSALSNISSAAQQAGSAFNSFNNATSNISYDLIPALRILLDVLQQIAAAAAAAADAISSIPDSPPGAGAAQYKASPYGATALATPPMTVTGGGGGVTVNVGPVTISSNMDLAEFGQYIRREVVAAMG